MAGTGVAGYNGDGIPGPQAQLNEPQGLHLASDGSLYIGDGQNHRIRRLAANGIITSVAGNGSSGCGGPSCGDGGPATLAQLNAPFGAVRAPDGSLYISDSGHSRVRRVAPDGTISTVAGVSNGSTAENIPATQALVNHPGQLALAADGSLYIAECGYNRARRLSPSGLITTLAGDTSTEGFGGFSGDGGPALAAHFNGVCGIAVAADGTYFISDFLNHRIRQVGPDGIIATIAGGGDCGGPPCGDGGPATRAELMFPIRSTVAPDGALFLVDASNGRVRHIGSSLPGISVTNLLIASGDGAEVYELSSSGKHLRTLDAYTGGTLMSFSYDLRGRLVGVTDGYGDATLIDHLGGGDSSDIVATFGQHTHLTVNGSGYLTQLTNPANETTTLTPGATGLLTALVDPLGHAHQFLYDSGGRLTKDTNPVGGFTQLARTEHQGGYTITTTNALGHATSYETTRLPNGDERRVITAPNGAITTVLTKTDGSYQTTDPRGVVSTTVTAPDARWGMQAPYVTTTTMKGTDNQVFMTITGSRSTTLSDPTNPFSLVSKLEITTVNGHTTTSLYTAATRSLTVTDRVGLPTTTTNNLQGAPLTVQVANLAPIQYAYDSHGRLVGFTEGSGGSSRTTTVSYDASSYLANDTDAMGNVTTYASDLAGRSLTQTLPTGQILSSTYDAAGRIITTTNPQGIVTGFEYDADDRPTAMTIDPGGRAIRMTYAYDQADNLLTLTEDAGPGRLNITSHWEYTPVDPEQYGVS